MGGDRMTPRLAHHIAFAIFAGLALTFGLLAFHELATDGSAVWGASFAGVSCAMMFMTAAAADAADRVKL